MIDAIQRFGIEYHFEEEIEEALQRKPLMMSSRDQDLYDVALQFRLLRQQGYYVHADVFDTFRDKKGNLKEKVCKDIMGLLQLHEASQLSVQGEKNLDEAGEISRELLLAWLSTNPNNNDHQKAKLIISNALQFPLHKSLPRFSERSSTCLNSYDFQFRIENKVWIDTFQELAKFDSYVVNSIHQQELLQVSK
ncbi:(3S,6E)-nerolidol synthase 1 [Senna tora]|uniref:(3S,6E)-nerolidol synthase 1 n=1 Tax=Senna tora TaxID=362788 RepID=A0A834SI44_9FABA|nr:(3S,6E)-nerolidol synthase 1 [Senna tora]